MDRNIYGIDLTPVVEPSVHYGARVFVTFVDVNRFHGLKTDSADYYKDGRLRRPSFFVDKSRVFGIGLIKEGEISTRMGRVEITAKVWTEVP